MLIARFPSILLLALALVAPASLSTAPDTDYTASLDTVSVQVDYTVPIPNPVPAYDDNGNQTTDGTYGNRTFTYDTLGRLTGVTGNGTPGNTMSASYTLDGAGNRWAETIGGVSTSFDLDLSVANPTILADGTNRYLPADPGAGYETGGIWRNALRDLTGSPIEYVDTAGAISGLVHYDPFGAPRPGSTAGVGIGYGGEYRNATGLVNLRARAYDPVRGRFISADSFGGIAGSPQSANRYAYALGNPLRYTDLSGHLVNNVLRNPGTWLLAASIVNPWVAIGIAGYTWATGTDPITNTTLSPEMRTVAGGLALLGVAGKVASRVAEAWAETGGIAAAREVESLLAGSSRIEAGAVSAAREAETAIAASSAGRQALLNRIQEARIAGGNLDELKGIVYATRQMEQRGYELLDASFAYSGRHGVDLVFQKGETFAIVEAKASSKGIGALVTDTRGIRQGSNTYNVDRITQYLKRPNQPNAPLAEILLKEAEVGRLESFATFHGAGRTYQLPFGWPAVKALR